MWWTVAIATARLEVAFGLSEADAAAVAPLVAQGIVANYAGDEAPSPQTQAVIGGLIGSSDPQQHALGMILLGLWTDLPPSDGTLVIPVN